VLAALGVEMSGPVQKAYRNGNYDPIR